MGPTLVKWIVIVCMLIGVLVCVLLPIKFTSAARHYLSDRYAKVVSILNCFAAGIFLGTCLLHLFPDVLEAVSEAMDPNQEFPFPEFTIAFGFFLLLTIEQIIAAIRERNRDTSNGERQPILTAEGGCCAGLAASANDSDEIDRHNQNAPIRAFAITFALAIHSIFEGIAIGVQSTSQQVLELTGAIIIHKIIIAFSLGLTLAQCDIKLWKSSLCGFIFAAASPLGIAIGLLLESIKGSLLIGSLQGMAAGTFLYVTFLELLPHEFRCGHMHLPKLLSLILGFVTISAVIFFFPDKD